MDKPVRVVLEQPPKGISVTYGNIPIGRAFRIEGDVDASVFIRPHFLPRDPQNPPFVTFIKMNKWGGIYVVLRDASTEIIPLYVNLDIVESV
jgi:hypothetical protein